MSEEHSLLPRAEFALPGELRDRLVEAILTGSKTATTSLVRSYEREETVLPVVGQRWVVVDSHERPVAVMETTRVRIVALGEVDDVHVHCEGEGDTTLESWRAAHERFWCSDGMRASLGDGFVIDDSTLVVLERFTMVSRL